MNEFAIRLGRSVCTAVGATLGFTWSCSGTANHSVIGIVIVSLLAVTAGLFLMRRV